MTTAERLRPAGNALPLALTMGDPAGIGGEISLQAWRRRGEGVPPFVVLDDPERLARLAAMTTGNIEKVKCRRCGVIITRQA